jgi:hypothetical protein
MDDFVAYYRNSHVYQLNKDDMGSYAHEFVEPRAVFIASGHATTTNKKSVYVISIPMHIAAVMVRRFQIGSGAITMQVVGAW